MKRFTIKLMHLFLVLGIICLSVSDGLAQTDEEAYRNYLEQYYKDKSPEEIWHDYINSPTFTVYEDFIVLLNRASIFKEPFLSWAEKELLKHIDYSSNLTATFLSGPYSKESKEKVLGAYLSFMPPPLLPLPNQNLERIMSLVDYIKSSDFIIEEERASLLEVLIGQILRDPDTIYLSNDRLANFLIWGSSEQGAEIAQRILNNNPTNFDLYSIAEAHIKIYSEIADSRLSLSLSQENIFVGIDYQDTPFEYIKRSFLAEKMDRPK